jgi:hypothetical protein
VAVEVFNRPTPDHEIVAYQEIGGKFSPPSGHVDIEFQDNIPSPVVIPPVHFGDTEVWCDNLLVDAHVRLSNRRLSVSARLTFRSAVEPLASPPTLRATPPDCPRHDMRWR